MADARLVAIEVERFKSYEQRKRLDLRPLTVIVGRNNSGKSTLIQAILLLKQTLAGPRVEVPLDISGPLVQALSLRELTFGWPEVGGHVVGPTFAVEWCSTVDLRAAKDSWVKASNSSVAERSGVPWLGATNLPSSRPMTVRLELRTAEVERRIVLTDIILTLLDGEWFPISAWFERQPDGSYAFWWRGAQVERVPVTLNHFVPYIDRAQLNLGRNDYARAYVNAWLSCFAPPLEDLKRLLRTFQYLGSTRTTPPTFYLPVTTPPEEVGVSGEHAPGMLWARRAEVVHYMEPLRLEGERLVVGDTIQARPLHEAVNAVLEGIGMPGRVDLEAVQELGFRLLFGHASFQHVGWGLTYLLPVVEIGLLADPLRFTGAPGELTLAEYEDRCDRFGHLALEEPEAHVHPKVQSLLTHWLLALARARRQIIVETHSDHIVRRLRRLAASAEPGSELEAWLQQSVSLVEIDQDDEGRSTAKFGTLAADGDIADHWPSDFMDQASDEESAIYDRALDKSPPPADDPDDLFIDDEGEEPEAQP